MKRIQLFEFEDYPWFPSWLRACITNVLRVLLEKLGVSEIIAQHIAQVLQEKNITNIMDLGSGSGGAMPDVLAILHEKHGLSKVQLRMTDLYPNPMAIQQFNQGEETGLHYHTSPVDATELATAPAGLKTMINCFHHMPPDKARKILASAQGNGQPIFIYEMVDNSIPLVVWWLFLPISLLLTGLMALFLTFFVRPFTWRQFVFTFLIPIIPICYAWDGQASMPRVYSLEDMDELLEGLDTEGYTWQKGLARKANGSKLGLYVLGLPTN